MMRAIGTILALLLASCGYVFTPRGHTVSIDEGPLRLADVDATIDALDRAFADAKLTTPGDVHWILLSHQRTVHWIPMPADPGTKDITKRARADDFRVWVYDVPCLADTALAHELAHVILCGLLVGVPIHGDPLWNTCDHEHSREAWWRAVNAADAALRHNHPSCTGETTP